MNAMGIPSLEKTLTGQNFVPDVDKSRNSNRLLLLIGASILCLGSLASCVDDTEDVAEAPAMLSVSSIKGDTPNL